MINNSLKPIVTDRSFAIRELIKQWILKDRQSPIEKPDAKPSQPEQPVFKIK